MAPEEMGGIGLFPVAFAFRFTEGNVILHSTQTTPSQPGPGQVFKIDKHTFGEKHWSKATGGCPLGVPLTVYPWYLL